MPPCAHVDGDENWVGEEPDLRHVGVLPTHHSEAWHS